MRHRISADGTRNRTDLVRFLKRQRAGIVTERTRERLVLVRAYSDEAVDLTDVLDDW